MVYHINAAFKAGVTRGEFAETIDIDIEVNGGLPALHGGYSWLEFEQLSNGEHLGLGLPLRRLPYM